MRTAGRITIAVVIVGLVIFWIYVFVVADQIDDRIPDRTYTQKAQVICRSSIDELRQAGLIDVKAASPPGRADLAERQDGILAVQVQRLRAIEPTDDTSREAVTKWLADWDTWLRDRAAWVTKLRAGEDAPFLEAQDDKGTPSSAALNIFARVNQMPDCATPLGI
jgi:hypothetical protein